MELALEGTDKCKDFLSTTAFKKEVVVEVKREVKRLTAKTYNNSNHAIFF